MPRRLSKAEIDRFLSGRHVAVLGTNSANGAPVLTPIWYLYRDGRILMRTDKGSVKTRNIEPRSARDGVRPGRARALRQRHCVRQSRRRTRPAKASGDDMARHYLGAIGAQGYKRAASEAIERGEEVTLVITPERVLTQDYSQETPWFGKLWLVLKRVLPPQL